MSDNDDWQYVQTEELFVKRLKPIEAYNSELNDGKRLVSKKDFDFLDMISLESKQQYQATSDHSLHVLSAFAKAHSLGIYPPLWVLDELYKAFAEYLGPRFDKSLDQILRLTPTGKGKEPPLKTAWRASVEEKIVLRMWQIQHIFGLSLNQAAEMEARRLAEANKEWSRDIPDYSVSTIITKYKRSEIKDSLNSDSLIKLRAELSEQELKERFLFDYPEDCIPDYLK